MLTNHGTKVFFSGNSDLATLILRQPRGGRGEGGPALGDDRPVPRAPQPQRLDHPGALVPTDVLRQALLVHGTLPPARLHARPYYGEAPLTAVGGRRAGVTGTSASAAVRSPARRPARDPRVRRALRTMSTWPPPRPPRHTGRLATTSNPER